MLLAFTFCEYIGMLYICVFPMHLRSITNCSGLHWLLTVAVCADLDCSVGHAY